ncbi:Ankyrin repeat [Dillenia turbinata]|uniref:Ankyrin repeat n=1 Tax=Dillenia turbinata TaxID=194707 RepID=A0AAN8ZJJ4_9MAGN
MISSPNSMNPNLYEAVVSGDINFLKTTKLDILSEETPQKSTILHIVVGFKQVEFMKTVILLYQSLLKRQNSSGDTPFHCAARNGSCATAELLISTENVENRGKEGSLLRMDNEDGNTALHVAVRNRRRDVAKTLIKADTEPCNRINKDKGRWALSQET